MNVARSYTVFSGQENEGVCILLGLLLCLCGYLCKKKIPESQSDLRDKRQVALLLLLTKGRCQDEMVRIVNNLAGHLAFACMCQDRQNRRKKVIQPPFGSTWEQEVNSRKKIWQKVRIFVLLEIAFNLMEENNCKEENRFKKIWKKINSYFLRKIVFSLANVNVRYEILQRARIFAIRRISPELTEKMPHFSKFMPLDSCSDRYRGRNRNRNRNQKKRKKRRRRKGIDDIEIG